MAVRRTSVKRLIWFGILALGLILANLLALRWRPNASYHLDIGAWGDNELLRGFWQAETDPAGKTYRWTTARSAVVVRGFAAVQHPVLEIDIGGLPPGAAEPRLVDVTIDNAHVNVPITAQARHYHLLVPSAALQDGDLDLQLMGRAAASGGDPREVGVRLDDVRIGWSPETWALPGWRSLGAQLGLLGVWLAILWRISVTDIWLAAAGAAAVPLLAVTTAGQLLVATPWFLRVLASSLFLLMFVWNALGWLRTHVAQLSSSSEARWLLLVTVVAIGLRVFAVFYPAFESHDLYIHRKRLLELQLGALELFDTPSEFAGSRTIVPPAYYLLASPLALLTRNSDVAIQGLYAFIDGASALLMGVLVRRLGGSFRAGLIAAILISVLPIQITPLWWGFGPQVVSQWLVLLLAILVVQRGVEGRAFWLVAGLVLLLVILMHPGTAILDGAALAGYVALMWWHNRNDRRWLYWGATLLATGLLALLMLYSDVIALQLGGLTSGAAKPNRFDTATRLMLIWLGMLASLRPVGVLLALLSLAVLVRRVHGPRRWLVASWLAAAGLFLLVDIISSLQVRYAYFAIPLLCAGLALLLDSLMRRWRWGAVAGWGFVAYTSFVGLSMLFAGMFQGVKPTLMSLLH